MTNHASQQPRDERENHSVTSYLQRSRSDFSRAQATALTALAQAGRACSARELAGGHHIGPITLTLQWLVTKGHVRTQIRRPTGAERAEPVYELTDEGRTTYQRLTTHAPAGRPPEAPESRT
ncbi:hypothetical protein APR12_006327 [Nocardia amikacinitolerans]|uniref:hypothetical protein n=1 Tax=Nocardia amikacinitolerans TaxID=756689 RepID=UPI000833336E|nr:hypothetical protein [Nocardia amikacinitolerans]MCP2320937.1 hypothetical protein [Nocardia amikacinitolerans]